MHTFLFAKLVLWGGGRWRVLRSGFSKLAASPHQVGVLSPRPHLVKEMAPSSLKVVWRPFQQRLAQVKVWIRNVPAAFG